ncbi:MAG: hypothetical protein ABI947_01985 [Chloroflexota bacterium]
MSSNQPDPLAPFQPIGIVIGLMLMAFGLLQAILPISLVQPIGTAVAGLILT